MLFYQKCTVTVQTTNEQSKLKYNIVSWRHVIDATACDFIIWSEHKDSKVRGIHFFDQHVNRHATWRKDSWR